MTRVAATPHVNARHLNRSEEIESRRDELIARFRAEGIGLRIEAGAEISASHTPEITDEELRKLSLGHSNWLLIEPNTRASAIDIHRSIFALQQRSFDVLVAHPERIPAFQGDLDLLASLVAGGVRTQVTAEALTGRFGSTAERCARELFKRNLVHTVASDAHHATERAPGMAKQLKRSGHEHLIQWLCRDMPSWILDGGEEPKRPETKDGIEVGEGGSFLRRLGLRR